MNISDLFIIYLACGAPCAVYFLLQNRKKLSSKNLWLKSFLTLVVWIPYAFVLLNDFATRRKQRRRLKEKSALEEKLARLQKQLLQFHFDSAPEQRIFEFREVLDRYAGLTLACNSIDQTPNPAESEFFRIALRENSHVAAECLRRRNQSRLKFHQNSARKDFLKIILELKSSVTETELLKAKAIEFVEMLNDAEARQNLEEIFIETLQRRDKTTVQNLEKEVWNSKEIKPQPSSPIHIRLKASIATTAKKD
jgi:hypothetical protein